MTKKKTRVAYRGELATPIPIGFALAAKLEGVSRDEWLLRHESRKLSLLFEHYAISPDAADKWAMLAYVLAKDHVPAFQIGERARSRGRPRKNHSLKGMGLGGKSGRKPEYSDTAWKKLIADVEAKCKENKLTGHGRIAAACRAIVHDWEKQRGKKLTPAQIKRDVAWLQRRYSEAVKRFPEMLK